ncbi:MAG TPA: hypothetical protein VHL57_06745 [Flavobacteriales bacterium]|nr:hypothetical protein [Flavobacteriales bacterium]
MVLLHPAESRSIEERARHCAHAFSGLPRCHQLHFIRAAAQHELLHQDIHGSLLALRSLSQRFDHASSGLDDADSSACLHGLLEIVQDLQVLDHEFGRRASSDDQREATLLFQRTFHRYAH